MEQQQQQPVFKEGSYEYCATDPSKPMNGSMKIKLDGSSTVCEILFEAE